MTEIKEKNSNDCAKLYIYIYIYNNYMLKIE